MRIFPLFQGLLSLILTLGIAALAAPLGEAASGQQGQPNVLLIAVDDLNDWIGCLGGHPQARTPNLDRLAGRGVLFRQAHCAAPACNPSRAALMSGVRPFTSGVYLNPQPWRRAMPEVVTLQQHFRAQGYHVRGGGKIFHGIYEEPQSWDEWFESGKAPPLPVREKENPHQKAGGIVWGNLHDTPVEEMVDHRLATWVAAYLEQEQSQPFFIGCGFKKPHMPWQVPGKYYAMFPVEQIVVPEVPEDDLDDLPPAALAMANPEGDHARVTGSKNWKYAVQGYLATIAFLDEQVGRVLDALDRGPHAGDTIIMLWGDHGWHLGEKQHWRKFALWEEATKAPLMIVAPGVTKAGGVCDAPVDFMSLYPTLCDLCALPPPSQLEGVTLRPLLEDPEARWRGPALTTHGRGNHAVRTRRWRYIRYSNGDEELYDHRSDPGEWKNLADLPGHEELKSRFAAFMPNPDAEAEEAERDSLKSERKQRAQKKAGK